MTGRLFLSPLATTGGTLRRPQPGRWHSANEFLDQYSLDILVEGSVGHQQIVRGVPSVFAQPIYFTHALGKAEHPAHRAAIGQWRGLLACFALETWLDLPLEVQRFDITRTNGNAASPDAVFRKVLEAQLPAPQEDWRDWWLLRCAGKLLGASSPWTLVYPPAQCEAPSLIPWQRGGVLIDPIEHYNDGRERKPSTELALLAEWVERVLEGRANLWGAPRSNGWDVSLGLVTKALEAWQGDLARYRQNDGKNRPLASARQEVASPYAGFLRSIAAEGVAASGLTLQRRDGREVIVLKRKDLDPKSRVHGATLVEELDLVNMPAQSAGAWRTRSGREIGVPFLFAAEAFLCDALTEFPISSKAMGLKLRDRTFALPLRREVFEFFTPDDLYRGKVQVSLRENRDDLVIQLKFPLADGTEFQVERAYGPAERLDAGMDVAIGLWPDFVSEDFPHSLALVAAAEGTPVYFAPLDLAGRQVGEPIAGNQTKREFVAWKPGVPTIGFGLFDADGDPVGLVLRKTLSAPPLSKENEKWRVSVDFGTSNTHLMVVTPHEETPRSLEFRPRTVLLTSGSPTFDLLVEGAFFPSTSAVIPPFPTILLRNHGFLAGSTATGRAEDCLSPRFSYRASAVLSEIVENLKWPKDSGQVAEHYIRTYLNVLAIGVLAEAIAHGATDLTFHWSYPLSLSDSVRNSLSGFWSTVPMQLSSRLTRVAMAAEGGRSESEGLSRCFANVKGDLPIRADSLTIAVDVGGGSTDLGFWTAGNFLDQGSFKLAGNDVLVRVVKQLPNLLREIQLATGHTTTATEFNEKSLGVTLNGLLFGSGERVPLRLFGQGSLPGTQPWSSVRSVIYLFFSGVVFYLGLVSRRYVSTLGRSEAAILFGGKASELLRWLHPDPAVLSTILTRMYQGGLGYDQSQLSQYPVVFFGPGLKSSSNSPAPKSEVAFGLLMDPLRGEKPTPRTTTLLGEKAWRTSKQATEALPWDTELDHAVFESLVAPDNFEASYASYFATTLIPRFVDELQLDVGLKNLSIQATDLEAWIRGDAAQKVIQPVFAGELRVLIEKFVEGIKES